MRLARNLRQLEQHLPAIPPASQAVSPDSPEAILALEADDNRTLIARMAQQGLLCDETPDSANGRRLSLKGIWHVFRYQVFPFNLPAILRADKKSRPLREAAS